MFCTDPKAEVTTQMIDPLHWKLQNGYSDTLASFVNLDNPSVNPTIESFFKDPKAMKWFADNFQKPGLMSSSTATKIDMETSGPQPIGKTSGILVTAASNKKEALKDARAKKQPKTAPATLLSLPKVRLTGKTPTSQTQDMQSAGESCAAAVVS